MDLAGRVALVTGAAGGIGQATALELAKAGADVALLDLNEAGLEEIASLAQNMGRRTLACQADVSQATAVESAVRQTVETFGRLDILVNNAGIVYVGRVIEMSETDWDRVLAVNLKGCFLCCRAAIPHMQKQGWGRIINIGSVNARNGGLIAGANYVASKGGVWAMTKTLARELAGDGINVNCVMPGVIDTPMTQDHDPRAMADITTRVPVGRLGQPEDIAGAILFLASESADYITGATLDVNGGLRMD